MGGSGGEDRGDGDDAVGGIQVQLVTDPGFPEPLAVAFDTRHHIGLATRRASRRAIACAAARCGSAAWVAVLRPCADAHAYAYAWAAQAVAGHPTTGGGVSRGLRSRWHRARYDRRCDLADDGGRAAHAHVPADLVRRTRQRRARRLPRWEPRSGVPSRRCVAVHDRAARRSMQGGCGGDGEHGLGDEAAGDGGAVIRWPAARPL